MSFVYPEVEKIRKAVRGELRSISKEHDLSAGALSWKVGLNYRFRLESVTIKFSSAVSPTVTITLDSKYGDSYDTVLRSTTLSSAQNYAEFFGEGYEFERGDDIRIDISSVSAVAYIVVRVSAYD
ncbi:MAG: hypothetical protein DRO09_00125 [Thermoprotei archaeon]|nr:MAG: hypothetical protein DRO09_00125 [Thermoprotei archaeon]